jgi:hypothetical protein
VTAPSNDVFFDRALGRIVRTMAGLGLMGTALAWSLRGWRWGLGFAAGAAVSWVNYRWLKQIVDALAGKRPKKRTAILAGLRYLLLAIGAYAILKSSVLSLPAALMGLFTAVAAVLIEILFELVYARH